MYIVYKSLNISSNCIQYRNTFSRFLVENKTARQQYLLLSPIKVYVIFKKKKKLTEKIHKNTRPKGKLLKYIIVQSCQKSIFK